MRTTYLRGEVSARLVLSTLMILAIVMTVIWCDGRMGSLRGEVAAAVQTQADLEITKTAQTFTGVSVLTDVVAGGSYFKGISQLPNPIGLGTGQIQYELNYRNNGPGEAVNVAIRDQIPANTKPILVPSATPSATGFIHAVFAKSGPLFECRIEPVGLYEQVICRPENNVPLPAGAEGTVWISVYVPADVAQNTIISNAAKINSEGIPDILNPNPVVPPAGTPDPNGGNNTSVTTQNRVITVADVGVAKIDSVDPVIAGTEFDYTITVINAGPSDARGVVLTDSLPAELVFSRIVSKPAEYACVTPPAGSTGTITCTRGILPPTGSGSDKLVVRVRMLAETPRRQPCPENRVAIGTLTAQSLSVPASPPPLPPVASLSDTLPNEAVESTCVIAVSDIAVSKSFRVLRPNPLLPDGTAPVAPNRNTVVAGTEFEYLITLTNNGPSAARQIRVIEDLPVHQRLLDVQITQVIDGAGMPGFACSPGYYPVEGGPGTSELVCDGLELPPNTRPDGRANASGTVTFRLRVLQRSETPQDNSPSPQPEVDIYQNRVTVLSQSVDPVSGGPTDFAVQSSGYIDTAADAEGRFDNARFVLDVPVSYLADLSVTGKTGSPDPAIAGMTLSYTIRATSSGPSNALNLAISDTLPAGTVFVSATAAGASLTTPAVGAAGTVIARWDLAGGTAGGLTAPGVERLLTIEVRICADYQQSFLPAGRKICEPNLTNTATVASDTRQEAGWTGNDSAAVTTTVTARADLAIVKSGPASAPFSTSVAPSSFTYTLQVSNDGPSNSNGTVVTDVLPRGFTAAAGGLSSTIPGTSFTVSEQGGVVTVRATIGALGAAGQCATQPRPTTGTLSISVVVPIAYPVVAVSSTATISSDNCLADPDPADNSSTFSVRIVMPGAGTAGSYPATSEAADLQPGSILIFPVYTSDPVNVVAQETMINLTNTSASESACLHLYAVDGTSCSVLDMFVCLTPGQTTKFLASDLDPGSTGYMLAVAVDCQTGLPAAFNCLIGDAWIRFASGHQASLAAQSILARTSSPAGTDATATSATLRFNGVGYSRLPRALAVDSLLSVASGNQTLLIVDRLGGNLGISAATIGNLAGLLFDDSEVGFSFTTKQDVCQLRTVVSNSFPRTLTPFTRAIPAGRSGWMKFWIPADAAIVGALFVFNPGLKTDSAAYVGGHNLHHLTLADNVEIILPVYIPSC